LFDKHATALNRGMFRGKFTVLQAVSQG